MNTKKQNTSFNNNQRLGVNNFATLATVVILICFSLRAQTAHAASDLVVSGAVSASPNPVTSGNNLTVSLTIRNQGSSTAAASTTRVQIKNAALTSTIFDQNFSAPSIAAGGSAAQTYTVAIPAGTTPDAYNAYITLDRYNAAGQGSNTGNDYASSSAFNVIAPAQYSDLVVSGSVSVSPNPVTSGNNLTVSLTIRNQGSATASASTTRVQVKNAALTATIVDQNFSAPSIAAGSSAAQTYTVAIPAGTTPDTYNAYITLDRYNAGGQGSNTGNDYASSSAFNLIAPAQYSDLIVSGSVSVSPNPVTSGSNLTVSLTIRNQGSTTASASTTRVQVKNAALTSTIVDQNFSAPSIAAGGSTAQTYTLAIPAGATLDSYNAYIALDRYNTAGQGGNTGNDYAASPAFSITTPVQYSDLAVSGEVLVMPGAVTAGSNVTVTVTMTNLGPGAAATSTTRVQIKNASLTSTIVDQDFSTPSIVSSGSITQTFIVAIPSGTTPNTFNAYITVDRYNAANQGGNTSNDFASSVAFSVVSPTPQATVIGTEGLGLRLRAMPTLSAGILNVIPEGTLVGFLGDTQNAEGFSWWHIQYGAQAGWAVSQFLTLLSTNSTMVPGAPTNLRQLQADGITSIPNGGNTTSGSVVLAATANGSSAQLFKLQFEVRPSSTSFSSPTHESAYIQGGNEARVTANSLVNQQGYKFRVRELNTNGQASAWVQFGSVPAFVVNNPQLPSALFVLNPTLPFTGQAVQFTAQAAGTVGASFVWNFGDGQTATGSTVSHTFTQAGQLNVKLTASNSQGSQDHTETISVVSQNLQQQINDLSQRTTNLLNQLLVDAHQCATAADYFQEGVSAAPSQIALSAAFDAMSLGKTAADMKDWIKLTLKQDVVVEGHTEVVKWVSGWILNQAVNSHQSYESIFIPNLETFVAQKKSEIEILRQQALSAASSLPQQQADQLAANLRARASGNVALTDNYSSKARLPITYADLKSYDESSWSFIAGEHLFGVSVGIGLIAVGDGVHGAPAVLLSVSSTAGLGTLDSVKILAGQDTDSQMLGLSVDVLAQATLAVRDMADNTKNGLQAVRDAQVLETPKGQITVQHIAQGSLDSFGFSPRWFTVSARADVTVQNNGTIPADYYVQAVYPNSFTTVGLLPFHTYGIGERSYDIPVMSVTNGIRLNPGEQTTVQLWFKTQDGGQVPNGLINYTLFAATTNGSYLADAETGQFATTLVDQNSNAVDHATMPDVLLAASPVHSTLIKYGGSSICSYNIYIANPLDSSLLLNLQQGLPSGTIVVEADEGTVNGNQMLWELNLPPGASRLIQTTLSLPSGQSSLTNAVLAAYDAINTTWLQFQATPTTVPIQDWPASQLQVTGLTSNGFAMTARHFVPGVFQSQWTTNFTNWHPLTTTTNSQGVVEIQDADAVAKPMRLYRTVKIE